MSSSGRRPNASSRTSITTNSSRSRCTSYDPFNGSAGRRPCFAQLQELLVPAAPPDERRDASRPHIQSSQDRQHAMPTIGLLDAHRLAWAHRASRMEGLQDLELGFLVGTNDPRPAGRMQVQPYDPTDFRPKVGIRTVQPSAHAMGFEIGVAQPSVNRALADSTDEVPLHGSPSEWSKRPVRTSAPQLRAGATRHG